jgi:hypothetical protein
VVCKVPEGNMQRAIAELLPKIVNRKRQNNKHNDNIDANDDTFIILRENSLASSRGKPPTEHSSSTNDFTRQDFPCFLPLYILFLSS